MSGPLSRGPLLMVGCGNMGRAMLDRWLASGLAPAEVTVVSPSGRAMPDGIRVVRSIGAAGGGFGTVMLALKPQQLGDVSGEELTRTGATSLISILGGITMARLTPLLPGGAVIRAMPNLPVGIGQGVVAMVAADADRAASDAAEALMTPLGLVEWIADERLFGAVTALAGCGPGFVFRFVAALAAAGEALGLDAVLADKMARATVSGAGAMASLSPDDPNTLADRVASPGGSTRAGLNVLDDDDALKTLIAETLAAAARRDAEMARG